MSSEKKDFNLLVLGSRFKNDKKEIFKLTPEQFDFVLGEVSENFDDARELNFRIKTSNNIGLEKTVTTYFKAHDVEIEEVKGDKFKSTINSCNGVLLVASVKGKSRLDKTYNRIKKEYPEKEIVYIKTNENGEMFKVEDSKDLILV